MRKINLSKIVVSIILCFISVSMFANQPKTRPSVALVLAGGGAKGFAHIPVIEKLEELGIPIDFIVGTSAGAIIGGLYCSGWSTENMADMLININWNDLFQDAIPTQHEAFLKGNNSSVSVLNLKFAKDLSLQMGTGVLTGQETYELFKRSTLKYVSDVNFDDLPKKFRATATDLLTGEMTVFSHGDIAEAIRASISIPTFFETFEIDGNTYMDGGAANNLPIKVAKDLGYDIIIAVEISSQLNDNKAELESNPLMSAVQVYNMTQAHRNEKDYHYADLVIFPDVSGFTILDFPKGQDIYNKSKSSIESYTDKLLKIREKIYGNQEVQPYEYEEYSKKEYLIPTEFVINGAFESDKKFIQRLYNTMEADKFTEQAYNLFTDRIYDIGNYSKVTIRIKETKDATILELNLIQKKSDAFVSYFGGSFEGTFASDASSKLVLFADAQLRNLTGQGSTLSLKVNFLNSVCFSAMYMQPLGPRIFLTLDALYKMDRNLVTSGFSEQSVYSDSLVNENINTAFNFQLGTKGLLHVGASYNWIDSINTKTKSIEFQKSLFPNVIADQAFGVNSEFSFSSLDFSVFPTKGLFFLINGQVNFPIKGQNTPDFFTPVFSELEVAIPLEKKWSLITSIYGGSDFSQNLSAIPSFIATYGFPIGDRQFSPQIASKQDYGIHKLAAKIALQFQPLEQLTILGGQLLFSVYGSLANTWMNYSEISWNNTQWNAGVNCGVRIKSNLSLSLKIGAGTSCGQVSPFLSFDFGTLQY